MISRGPDSHATAMIRSFRSKALAQFWETSTARRLPVPNHARVRQVLRALNRVSVPEGMNVPGFKFHALNAVPKRWSVWVTGNYRITYGWDDGPVGVDLEDYH